MHFVARGTRKNHAHERVDDLLVLGNDGAVRDGFEQRWGLLQRLLHFDRERSLHRMLRVHRLLPERHQGRQAEFSRKWEGVGARLHSDLPVAG